GRRCRRRDERPRPAPDSGGAAARRGRHSGGRPTSDSHLRIPQPRRGRLRRGAGRPHGAGRRAQPQRHRPRHQRLHRPRARRRLGQGRPPVHAGPVEAGRAEPGLPAAAHAGRSLSCRHRGDQCVLPQDLREDVRPSRRQAARGGAGRPLGREDHLRQRPAGADVLGHRVPDRDGRHVRRPDLRRQPRQGGLEDARLPGRDRGQPREHREVPRQGLRARAGRHRGPELREGTMATKLKEVDVVVVGLGWTGGILSKELAQYGLKVVALERGGMRTAADDYSLPGIRDELRYAIRKDLMQNTVRDTLTVRNNVSQEALPMRRLGSFLPGEVVGGSAVHWSGHTWRWTDMELKVRSMYEERYGKKFIPDDMTIQDWGVSYAELEPHYERFEYTAP